MTPIDKEIQEGVDWGPYLRSRVQEYIQKKFDSKVGYSPRNLEKEEDGNFHLRGFRDEEAYNEWHSDPEKYAENVLSEVLIPEMSGGAGTTSYVVSLKRDGSGDIITQDNVVKLRIRATSQMYNPISDEKEDTGEGVTLTVQTRLTASSAWTTRGTLDIETQPADSQGWTTIDLTEMLSTGTQQVRIIAKGQETGASSTYVSFSVTKTTLGLIFANQWEKPITDSVMRLQFYIQGAVSKTLHLLLDGQRKIDYAIGTSIFTETPYGINITDSDRDTVKVLTHGIHEIEAWLSVNDSDVESEHIHCQVMVVADPENRTPFLILNDVSPKLTNWTAAHILSYALYNPGGESLPLVFKLTDYRGSENYMTLDVGQVAPGTRYSLDNSVEIESEQPELSAYMKFFSGERELHDMIGFEIDNSENYAPTPDADFILNPKTRTNNETNPLSIINSATGETIPSEWKGFGLESDGWQSDESGQKCLRLPAGTSIFIDYEAFSGFIGSDNKSSLTIEADLATRNADDIEEAILQMCTELVNDGMPLGFSLKPQAAVMMTQNRREYGDQDIAFQEGVRTHIAVNIIYGIYGSPQNYVRIFVNGVINREFSWETSDQFVQYVGGQRTSGGIRLGSATCDLDLYGMRVYKKALSATDIRKDYEATLPTVEQKRAFREANDILGDDNTISFAKTREKYNTLVITGDLPSYLTGNIKTTCDWDINIIGDPAHSGKINSMETSGQGTSSRSYWKWNPQGKFTSNSKFINLLGEESSTYALDDTVPGATKIVPKLNWASSQQSHKMGACNLYTDLWRRCVGGNEITATPGFENTRVSVKQKPFFLFTRKSENEEPVFYGLVTFGPGKGDKATFGFDKKAFPDYLMLEGCDNGVALANHRVPWNEDVTIGGDEDELIMYNGSKNWEIDLGSSQTTLERFKTAFNFIYLHNPHIEPYVGTLAELQEDNDVNRQHFYWLTTAGGGGSKFDLYRYDPITSQWVDAGIAKLGEGRYEKLNLTTQLGINPSGVMWEEINRQFIDARVAKFAAQAPDYIDKQDCAFTMMYCKFIGASDNRAKNTYLYIIGNTVLVIRFAQDDLDTIFLTDNVGRKDKPYYVEEHDKDAKGNNYWNGEENALYDLMERAFPQELRAMMKSILTEMANLASDHTVMGCFDDYFFSTQRYFPAVAYNETARLLYEEAALARAEGRYSNATDPLAQSLGDQLQGEMQWIRQRIVYMSSFAGYGQFAYNGEGRMEWRSILDSKGRMPEYNFSLTPHMWLYPVVNSGNTSHFGKGKAEPQRVKAGETYKLEGVESDGNTQIQILGADYYRSVGDFSDKPMGADFTVAGERLTEFTANLLPKEFRPTAITVTAPLLRRFDIEGASSVGGSISFARQKRLTDINLKGTSISSFSTGDPTIVTNLRLPATLTRLELVNYKNLKAEGFEIEGASMIQTLRFSGCPGLDSRLIVIQMCAAETNDLQEVSVDDIDWVDFPVQYLLKLAAIGAKLKGTIALSTSPTFEEKLALIEAFGNIDDPANDLYLTYQKVYLTSVELTGDSYYGEPGQYKLVIIPSSVRANDFSAIEWEMTANTVGATIDRATGVITVPRIGSDVEKPSATVTVRITTSDGTSVSSTMQIWFYKRECQVGDAVYYDGTYSDKYNKAKTIIGFCFYIDPDDSSRRLMVAREDPKNNSSYQWGLVSDSTNGVPGIALAESPGYNVYDTPIGNLGSTSIGPSLNVNAATLTAEYFLDESTKDGFRQFATSYAVGHIGFVQLTQDRQYGETIYPAGSWVPRGLNNSALGIAHRDKILQDSNVNLPVPKESAEASEYDNLIYLMNKVASDYGSKYRQYYYPPFSLCFSFVPTIKEGETLDERFGLHKWFLPAAGDLARIIYLYCLHNEVGGNQIFRELSNAGAVIARTRECFSSTEVDASWCWGGSFTNKYIRGNGNYGQKISNYYCIPVCAF